MAVAMVMDGKKRQMTEHLERTLSQVVKNWKKQEGELRAKEETTLLTNQQQQMQMVGSWRVEINKMVR
jgi:hypothetical protein